MSSLLNSTNKPLVAGVERFRPSRIRSALERRVVGRWRRFWLARGGYDRWGRMASWLGSLGYGTYRHLGQLVWEAPYERGFIAPSAEIIDVDLRLGPRVFIGERVVIAKWSGSGWVELGEKVELNREIMMELFDGGSIKIGAGTSIQPRCQFTSAVQPICIGSRVQIAPACAFYPYDHGVEPGKMMMDQPLISKGPIVIEDDAWLGYGVIVLSGVTIGRGAVVGAGSVVTRDIPPNGIAVGNPARVVRSREELGGGGKK
jgi:acetyltransferase-like isoleucine patch superfamily enzyme